MEKERIKRIQIYLPEWLWLRLRLLAGKDLLNPKRKTSVSQVIRELLNKGMKGRKI